MTKHKIFFLMMVLLFVMGCRHRPSIRKHITSNTSVCEKGGDTRLFTIKITNDGSRNWNQYMLGGSSKYGAIKYDYSVDCDSDGRFEAVHLKGYYTCRYKRPGTYTICIKGEYQTPRF